MRLPDDQGYGDGLSPADFQTVLDLLEARSPELIDVDLLAQMSQEQADGMADFVLSLGRDVPVPAMAVNALGNVLNVIETMPAELKFMFMAGLGPIGVAFFDAVSDLKQKLADGLMYAGIEPGVTPLEDW